MKIMISIRRIFLAVLVVAVAVDRLPAQALTSLDRERGKVMLEQVRKELREHYYDPTFGGSPLKQTDKARSVVLDLRGNGAGMDSALIQLVGAFVEQKTLVAYALRRNEIDTIRAEPRDPFKGRLVILIDSRTGGAAELFARLMQLSARATIVGDWSSGTGHMSTVRWQMSGAGRVVPYGVSLSTADLRLADGRTLERRGVMPDEIVVPTPADLAAGRDPALARAVAIAGGSLDPLAAGKIFPARWKR